jgi:hypothetical protein
VARAFSQFCACEVENVQAILPHLAQANRINKFSRELESIFASAGSFTVDRSYSTRKIDFGLVNILTFDVRQGVSEHIW